MPTMPMESAIGTRTNASTIMAASPISASVMRSGRGLRAASRAGHEDLEDVHQRGKQDHPRHEVDERPDGDAQHVGRVAISGDAVRLDDHLPREEKEGRGDDRVDGADQPGHRARRQHAVDEIHGDVLIAVRDQRQSREDEDQEGELGELEGAADRPVEEIARHDVDERQQHHGEEEGGSGDAEDGIDPLLPDSFGLGHPRSLSAYFFSTLIFLISARNSSSAALASTPFALAFLIQSSMIGAESLRTSAVKAGSARAILAFAFFRDSIPFWSAASHDWPLERAAYS